MFVCLYLKGGALVSVLRDYSQHGDPAIRSLLLNIESQVSGCGQWVWSVVDLYIGSHLQAITGIVFTVHFFTNFLAF